MKKEEFIQKIAGYVKNHRTRTISGNHLGRWVCDQFRLCAEKYGTDRAVSVNEV